MKEKVEIRNFSKNENEKGLFAICDIPKGELVFVLEGSIIDAPTRTSIQISKDSHIDWSKGGYFEFFNHSCEPNCFIKSDTLSVYSLIDIKEGSELFFNYNSTEYEMASPFKCVCGTTSCVGVVKGYKFLSRSQRTLMEEYVAKYLRILD